MNFIKTPVGLIPADEATREKYEKWPNGSYLTCDIKNPRNAAFHRKYFALLNVGFRYWEPAEISTDWGTPQKDFDTYRKQIAIQCGFYKLVFSLDNSSYFFDADSISFAKMTEDRFQELFSKTIDVLLHSVFVGYVEADVLKMVEDEILSFA